MMVPATIRLKENTWIAKLAAKKLGASHVALVIGRTIYLHNISISEFKASPKLIRHELKHVEQYQRYGLCKFLCLYAFYSLCYGYYNNPLEVEARQAENST